MMATKKKTNVAAELKKYFELQRTIYSAFGYTEDWVVIPLDLQTDVYWMLIGGDKRGAGGHVVWSDEPLTEDSVRSGKKIFSGPVYTQRFLPKWVWHSGHFTMIAVDTRTDGNHFLMVFDDRRRCDDKRIAETYLGAWGAW